MIACRIRAVVPVDIRFSGGGHDGTSTNDTSEATPPRVLAEGVPAGARRLVTGGLVAFTPPPAAWAAVCAQPAKAWVATSPSHGIVSTLPSESHQLTVEDNETIFLTGIVQPGSRIFFSFFRIVNGQPVGAPVQIATNGFAESNCVVRHEPEAHVAGSEIGVGTFFVGATYADPTTGNSVSLGAGTLVVNPYTGGGGGGGGGDDGGGGCVPGQICEANFN